MSNDMPETIEAVRLTADVVAATANSEVLLNERNWYRYPGHCVRPGPGDP
ncbi:hypothetical protein ACFQ8S_28305 [Streptomyces virginiae]